MNAFPDRLLKVLLGWTVFTAILPTLITYRAGLQPEYEWGLYGILGVGMTAGYFLVAATAALAWTIVTLGYRGTKGPFAILLILWHAFLFGMLLWGAIRFGSEMEIRGDALGLRLNIAFVGPTLGAAAVIASIVWARRNPPAKRRATTVGPANRALLAIAGTLTVAIAALFSANPGGEHHGTDRVAVILVILQGLMYAQALKPAKAQRLAGTQVTA